jgi:hypothetical protein
VVFQIQCQENWAKRLCGQSGQVGKVGKKTGAKDWGCGAKNRSGFDKVEWASSKTYDS